jgi:hypothetical protein
VKVNFGLMFRGFAVVQQRLSPVNSSGSVRMKLNWFLVLCAIDFLFVDKFITFWNYCAIIFDLTIVITEIVV